jgi:hypothetical protein
MEIKIGDKIQIGCHPYRVVFNKLLVDGSSFARSSHASEIIQLCPTNTQAQNTVSFWHEIIHTIAFNLTGENLEESRVCALSEGLCAVLDGFGIGFDFSGLKEITEENQGG